MYMYMYMYMCTTCVHYVQHVYIVYKYVSHVSNDNAKGAFNRDQHSTACHVYMSMSMFMYMHVFKVDLLHELCVFIFFMTS